MKGFELYIYSKMIKEAKKAYGSILGHLENLVDEVLKIWCEFEGLGMYIEDVEVFLRPKVAATYFGFERVHVASFETKQRYKELHKVLRRVKVLVIEVLAHGWRFKWVKIS